jgi:hypothetical protein
MAFARARSADEDGVALFGKEAAAQEIADQSFVDRRVVKLEAVKVLCQWQLGARHLIFDRPGLFFCDLGFQQIADNARRLVLTLDPGCHDLVVGGAHAVELQVAHQGENVGSFHKLPLLKLS